MPQESLLSTAYQFIQQGERQTAERLLTGLIRQEPQNEVAWLLMAACKSQPEEKKKCLEFVAEINPNNGAALQALREVLAGRDAHALILQAYWDWQAEETARAEAAARLVEETVQPDPVLPDSAMLEEEPAPAAAPGQRRTIWLWLAILLLGAGQIYAWMRIWQLEQALAAATVRVQSLQTILTEYIVEIELLRELLR